MPTNTVLTNAGINFASNAFNSGVLIAIKYCVPIYDYRLDANIHNGDPTFGTAAITYDSTIAATSALTVPTGEKLWFNTSYNLSNRMILSGSSTVAVSGATYAKISNNPQSVVGLGVNTLSGVPLSNSISATTFYAPSQTNYWLIDRATSARVVGVNPQTYTDRSKYWSVGDYFPTVNSNGDVVGSFRAHLNQSVGRFKFNKMAFYAVAVDTFGNENLGVAPTFFAECFVSELAVKSNIEGDGFDDFVIDGQISLRPLNAYGTSGFFSTSGDYWVRTVGGLYSPDPIGVGSFVGGVSSPQSTVHVRYVESNQRKENLLRFDASGATGDTKYITGNVNQNGDLTLSASMGFRTLSANMSLAPIVDSTFNIGTSTQRYDEGHINAVYTTDLVRTPYIYTSVGNLTVGSPIIMEEEEYKINSRDILPVVHDQYDLGTPSLWYAEAYINVISANNVHALNNLEVPYIYNGQGGVIGVGTDVFMDDDHRIITCDVLPSQDDQFNLGDPSYRYARGYFNNLSATNITCQEISSFYDYLNDINPPVVFGSDIWMEDGVEIISSTIYPWDHNTFDLGTSSLWYANAYITNVSANMVYSKYIDVVNALTCSQIYGQTDTINFGNHIRMDNGNNSIIYSEDIIPITTNFSNIGNPNFWYNKAYIRNISATNLSATSISATSISATSISATNLSATSLSAVTVSASNSMVCTGLIKGDQVSATNMTPYILDKQRITNSHVSNVIDLLNGNQSLTPSLDDSYTRYRYNNASFACNVSACSTVGRGIGEEITLIFYTANGGPLIIKNDSSAPAAGFASFLLNGFTDVTVPSINTNGHTLIITFILFQNFSNVVNNNDYSRFYWFEKSRALISA